VLPARIGILGPPMLWVPLLDRGDAWCSTRRRCQPPRLPYLVVIPFFNLFEQRFTVFSCRSLARGLLHGRRSSVVGLIGLQIGFCGFDGHVGGTVSTVIVCVTVVAYCPVYSDTVRLGCLVAAFRPGALRPCARRLRFQPTTPRLSPSSCMMLFD